VNYITFAVLFASLTARKNGRFITMENISLSARLTPQRNACLGKCGEREAQARDMSGQPFYWRSEALFLRPSEKYAGCV
jgi:hypothetical protein